MTAIELIAAALPHEPPPEDPVIGVCCVTGEKCLTVDRSHAIKPSFTNYDLLAAPSSNKVGVAAWRVLNHAPARQSLWWCDGRDFRLLKRADARSLVIDGVDAPEWCGYVTTSYKKHGALRCPVNSRGSQVWQFELLRVDCTNRQTLAAWWSMMIDAQKGGISRPIMESLRADASQIRRVGFAEWLKFYRWAESKISSPAYQFLCYLLPSQEEIKDA